MPMEKMKVDVKDAKLTATLIVSNSIQNPWITCLTNLRETTLMYSSGKGGYGLLSQVVMSLAGERAQRLLGERRLHKGRTGMVSLFFFGSLVGL